jgi:hypothetical protein
MKRCNQCTSTWKNLNQADPCPSCEEDDFGGMETKRMSQVEVLALRERSRTAGMN